MPHGRDKWDLMAVEILNDPMLTSWLAVSSQAVMQTETWKRWTPKERSTFQNLLGWRFGWAFYFGTVQVSTKYDFAIVRMTTQKQIWNVNIFMHTYCALWPKGRGGTMDASKLAKIENTQHL